MKDYGREFLNGMKLQPNAGAGKLLTSDADGDGLWVPVTVEADGQAVGFVLTGGTTPKTLTVTGDTTLSGTPILQNLLTNSQWMAMSGSTLLEAISKAAPVLDGANAALVNNLLTNGGVDSVTTGWTSYGSGSLSSEASGKTGNCLQILEAGAENPGARLTVTTVIGKLYQFNCYINNGTESSYAVLIGTSIGGSQHLYATGEAANDWTTTVITKVFEATTTETHITLHQLCAAGAATTIMFDSITCYEVTPGYIAADTLAPDGWIKDTTTLDVIRQHNDATYTKAGSFYSLKLVAGAAGNYLLWPGPSTANSMASHIARFAGRRVAFGAWVYASDASHARLHIYDNVSGSTYSAYHSGTPGWEWLEVTATFSATVASPSLIFQADVSGKTAYFSQPMLIFGSFIGSGNYQPIPNEVIWFQNSQVRVEGAAVPTTATKNVEAWSSGKIGKGVKALYVWIQTVNSAAQKDLHIGQSSGWVSRITAKTQVANINCIGQGWVSTDVNGDVYMSVEDGNFTQTYVDIAGIQT